MAKFHLKHRTDPIPMRLGAFEFMKKGASRYDLRDPYHLAVTLSWPHFFLGLLAVDLVLNLVFALLYMAGPGSIANTAQGSFTDAFFFSIETLATVGYGVMAPATLYGHIVSAAEILCGMTFTAIMTGLIFVRFSRPKAKILFADKVVITNHHGSPTVMVRIGNGRMTLLSDARARLNAVLMERTPEGHFYRTNRELKLVSDRMPLFALTWTLMHVIDESSPLAGYDADRLTATDVRLVLVVEARDHALNATVHDMKDWTAANVLFGMRYQDAIMIDELGRTNADLTKLSLVEPDASVAAVLAADAEANRMVEVTTVATLRREPAKLDLPSE
jgi:inward rectifier potassium channel